MLSRGQVSRMFGIKESTLRYYEREGIVVPARAENKSNERRAYTNEDLERLHQLAILKEYGFKLDVIKQILDGDIDLTDALDRQLEELRREENRIRNLVLFIKFLRTVDSDLIYGLEFGPKDIDEFADVVRDTDMYREAMQRIQGYSEDDLEKIFSNLDVIVHHFVTLDDEDGFAAVEQAIDLFCEWWDLNVVSIADAGYLGFWAIFEDDSIIVEEVENVGGETASSSLQMHAFYVWMKRLMVDAGNLIAGIADHADKDIVIALDEADRFAELVYERMGVDDESSKSSSLFELLESVVGYMERMLDDYELSCYLDLSEVGFNGDDLRKVNEIIQVMQPDGLEDSGEL